MEAPRLESRNGGHGRSLSIPGHPIPVVVPDLENRVFRVALVVGNDAELAGLVLRVGLESRGGHVKAPLLDLRTLEERRAAGLAVGAGNDVAIGGAGVIEALVGSGEADRAAEGPRGPQRASACWGSRFTLHSTITS